MKILLSSPMIPYPDLIDGRDSLHLKYSNTTYGQDIYSIPLISHYYGLHLIAQNIEASSTVIENPDEKTFLKEIKKHYDYVGIYFVIPFLNKVIEMCIHIRQRSPSTKIVVGGPGVECLKHIDGVTNDLLSSADFICRGDGINYFRKLLGENQAKPIKQDLPRSAIVPFGIKKLANYSPALFSELGCTNSCEFCSSSAFYNHKRVKIADPDELFQAVKDYIKKYGATSGRLLDENFLDNKSYVQRFGKLLKEYFNQSGHFFTYSTFASLNAIKQYNIEELVEYGVSGILIGVESNLVNELNGNVRRKISDISAVDAFSGLKNAGIFIEGSMIVGWDFHNKVNIKEDISKYVLLKATFDQIVCLQAVPGTVLWEKLKKENRLLKNIDWSVGGFYSRWFNYKNFTHEEIWKIEDDALKAVYEAWGPSYLRFLEVNINGYLKNKNSKDDYLLARASYHKEVCKEVFPLLLCMRIISPNSKVTDEVKNIRNIYVKEFGKPSAWQTSLSYIVLLLGIYRKIEQKLFKEKISQPDSFMYHYN